jgi:hypothetical protein
MADEILSLQMQAMQKEDYYNVMSSLPTWKDKQLHKFHEETQEAIKRGVVVRRIFNRLRYPEAEENLSLNETRRILQSHLANTRNWNEKGKYEVKILSAADLKKDESLRDWAHTAHFGIFKHGNESICYGVKQADLSHMMIVKNKTIVDSEQKLFDDAWAVASDLTEPLISDIIREIEEQQKQQTKAQYEDMMAAQQETADGQNTAESTTPSGPQDAGTSPLRT